MMTDPIFDDKTVSDLMKDIYSNVVNKGQEISRLVNQLTDFVEGVDSALSVLPLVKDLVAISVKNDEQLIQLTNIAVKLTNPTSKDSDPVVANNALLLDRVQIRAEAKRELETLREENKVVNDELINVKEHIDGAVN